MGYDVGIVGTGGIAARHATAYAAVDGIEIAAAADPALGALDRFGNEWDVPPDRRYETHSRMLDSEELDAVSICSPTALHCQHTLDAARSEAPDVIFCEKPIATSVADAREMVDACEAESVELLVDHTRRFHPDVQDLRDFLHAGALGEPISVNVQWSGELLRNGPHAVDLLLFLLDSTGAGVSGGHVLDADGTEQRHDDAGGAAILHLSNGALATFDLTRSRRQPAKVTDFVGTEGRLRVDWWDDELRYWECTDSLTSPRPEARESLYGDFRELDLDRFDSFSTESDTSFRNAAAHVRDLLDGEAENVSPGENALAVLELLVGIYVSHYGNGARVDLPLDRPLRGVTVSLP